jgi:hypothetical protein
MMLEVYQEAERVMKNYPESMVHESAASVILEHGLLPAEIAWLIASFALTKPGVKSNRMRGVTA